MTTLQEKIQKKVLSILEANLTETQDGWESEFTLEETSNYIAVQIMKIVFGDDGHEYIAGDK